MTYSHKAMMFNTHNRWLLLPEKKKIVSCNTLLRYKTTKWLCGWASETCSLSLKVRALNVHALAPDSPEHWLLNPDTPQAITVVSCMIYCRTYGWLIELFFWVESPGCRLFSTASMLEWLRNTSPTTHRGAVWKNGAEIPWGWSLPEFFTPSGGL